jgi:predicted secreted protein
MFNDARSRRIVLVAHCILNQNSISGGTADYSGCDPGLVRLLLGAQVGILQMPCPELNCLGLDRGDPRGEERPVLEENTRIRAAMGAAAPARILAGLVEQVVFQVDQYRRNGFVVLGIVGINRSPSCGVELTTLDGQEKPGRGVFLEALDLALRQRGMPLPVVGVRASAPEDARSRVSNLLRIGERAQEPAAK